MVNSLLSTEACATTQGDGMVTTWQLIGSTAAYSGTLTTTDGYNITASLTWKLLTSNSTDTTGQTCDSAKCAIGTCVETYDSAGVVVAATVLDDGNHAICHWFIIAASATLNTAGLAGTTADEYSIARYLTAAQFGTAGNAIIDSTAITTGTEIGASYGFTRSPTTKPTTYAAQAYTQNWYQPTFASTYASTVLRRYNGGTSDGDNVKAYCARLRTLTLATYQSTTALVAATVGGTSGVVKLTGSEALAAGAIAFGVAALAF